MSAGQVRAMLEEILDRTFGPQGPGDMTIRQARPLMREAMEDAYIAALNEHYSYLRGAANAVPPPRDGLFRPLALDSRGGISCSTCGNDSGYGVALHSLEGLATRVLCTACVVGVAHAVGRGNLAEALEMVIVGSPAALSRAVPVEPPAFHAPKVAPVAPESPDSFRSSSGPVGRSFSRIVIDDFCNACGPIAKGRFGVLLLLGGLIPAAAGLRVVICETCIAVAAVVVGGLEPPPDHRAVLITITTSVSENPLAEKPPQPPENTPAEPPAPDLSANDRLPTVRDDWPWPPGAPSDVCASCGHERRIHGPDWCAFGRPSPCQCAGFVSPQPPDELRRQDNEWWVAVSPNATAHAVHASLLAARNSGSPGSAAQCERLRQRYIDMGGRFEPLPAGPKR